LGESRYSCTHSLTSALNGGEWSASRPSRFPPVKELPGTHWIGGWVGPRAVLDAVVKRKIPSSRRERMFSKLTKQREGSLVRTLTPRGRYLLPNLGFAISV
jgi:hypothetical protein